MAHYDDLAPCDYFAFLGVERLLAVGWLGKGFAYPKGDPGDVVYRRLQELLRTPWQPEYFMGWHSCELCDDPNDNSGQSWDNLFIPGQTATYVAPEGILHYISVHGYCPPPEFREAVLACPDMQTPQYFERLVACGWGPHFEKMPPQTAELLHAKRCE